MFFETNFFIRIHTFAHGIHNLYMKIVRADKVGILVYITCAAVVWEIGTQTPNPLETPNILEKLRYYFLKRCFIILK